VKGVVNAMDVADIGTNFYFAPATEATWLLSVQSFTDAFKAQWPEGSVDNADFPDGPYVRFWIPGQECHGFFQANNLTIKRQTPSDAADFIEWFLALLPKDARIRFSSEIAVESGISDDWWLPRDAGKQQITEALTDHLAAVLAGHG
jgi:hypothetical protein